MSKHELEDLKQAHRIDLIMLESERYLTPEALERLHMRIKRDSRRLKINRLLK
jgi:hypothetical protein